MPNALIHEQSPYLLQHANNPVDWRPWGDAAFAEAREKNKPLIVSIGYAACHWCHVMERESFEDEATAAYMNEHFICIKVDREEHPDVDAMYMDAVQAISGSGGWPLNVFVTPERIPFYGGTYYPPRPAYSRPSWMQVMAQMTDIWQHQPAEILAQSGQMVNYLKQVSIVGSQSSVISEEGVNACASALLKMADKEWGGFGAAPKFPGTMAITFLLEHHHFYGDKDTLDHALLSLDKMIEGGIYDQLGGGFARYSTDREWLAPHFEKMLYDNALIVHTLCDAYAITAKPLYKEVIDETIAFINRELRDSSGGFYCALDADSEGVEGKFYTWTPEEWQHATGENEGIGAAYFGVSETGNWEETNILTAHRSFAEVAAESGTTESDVAAHISSLKQKLFEARSTRIRPATDDKCLLSWNALMNTALTRAAIVLAREDYLQQAATHAQWMLDTYAANSTLLHTWKNGVARIPAKLDDYAYLIQSLLQIGTAADQHHFIHAAASLAEYVLLHFKTENSPLLYFSSDLQTDIPVRKVDVYDGATPSANAVMMHNFYLLGMLMERSDWSAMAEEAIRSLCGNATRYTYSFSYWAMLLQRLYKGVNTALVAGGAGISEARLLRKLYAPGLFTLRALTGEKEIPLAQGKSSEGETLIFVCSAKACMPPVKTAKEAQILIEKMVRETDEGMA